MDLLWEKTLLTLNENSNYNKLRVENNFYKRKILTDKEGKVHVNFFKVTFWKICAIDYKQTTDELISKTTNIRMLCGSLV